MLAVEYIILAITYTSLSISLFLQVFCYRKKMENWQTMALTTSLLLLVISIGFSPLLPEENTTTLSTLICMVIVALFTFLETLSQQKHAVPDLYKKLHAASALVLILYLIAAYFLEQMLFAQYIVVGFLIVSVVVSMWIMKQTKPIKQFQHLEKSNKFFSITFLLLVPIYLVFHFGFNHEYEQVQLGFLLYFAFIALAVRKIHDDLQRLHIVNKRPNPKEQQFDNYGLTQREREIAELLFEGLTYQAISDQLHISLPTVKTHSSNVYKKCSVKNRNELSRLLSP